MGAKFMTTKNNKKESANKVNNAANVIAKFTENTKGLLSSNLGTKKSSIYKEELFENLAEKEKKSLRKKFRNMLFSAAKGIAEESNKEKQTKLINAFNELYLQVYKVNDYSLQSVCNENLSKEKKDILSKVLEICKK